MTTLPSNVDLLVVGAGTAGAALAGNAALRGMRVLCLDRRALGDAGAHWVNGVGRDDFRAAGIDAPTGLELRGSDTRFHLVAGYGPERLVLSGHGVLEVDMRLLVERLQRRALEAGATMLGDVRVLGRDGLQVHTSAGPVRARTIADASGLSGAGLLEARPLRRSDICAAAQAVHRVRDPGGARAFLEAHEVGADETLCFSGIAGGYSILNVRVAHGEVSLLTGSIPADGHASGLEMLRTFVAEQPWIGERIFGGHRPIPLGFPQPVLAEGPIARLGDAAGQVFAAHGSGISAGMIAARMLADALADGGGPEDYAVGWMRTHGGLFAAYDCFRRFSQRITLDQLRILFRSGLLDEASAGAGLRQEIPRPPLDAVLAMPGALREAGAPLAKDLVATFAQMAAAMALYRAYPRTTKLRGPWEAAVARLTDSRSAPWRR